MGPDSKKPVECVLTEKILNRGEKCLETHRIKLDRQFFSQQQKSDQFPNSSSLIQKNATDSKNVVGSVLTEKIFDRIGKLSHETQKIKLDQGNSVSNNITMIRIRILNECGQIQKI